MTCSHVREHLELFALRALEPADMAAVQQHLDSGCTECRREWDAIQEALAAVAYLAPPAEPPATLRSRVMNAAAMERPPARPAKRTAVPWKPFAWAAAAAAVAIFFVQESRLDRYRETVRSLQSEVSRQTAILDVLNAPEAREVIFGEGASGRVLLHPKLGVLMIARNLPAPPAGRVYQMWLVPRTGLPVSAGLPGGGVPGRVTHFHPTQVDLAQVAAVALSVEPPGGSPQPTTRPFLVVGL
ncbi:MAG TPA: hypothetical protein DEH78_04025 [Solibacterales bacterium]|nr:hypothetical protein [Bryobacterales bacterium]